MINRAKVFVLLFYFIKRLGRILAEYVIDPVLKDAGKYVVIRPVHFKIEMFIRYEKRKS